MRRLLIAVAVMALLAACTPPQDWSGYVATHRTTMVALSQTIDLENADRVARFRRLANIQGTTPPSIEQMYLPPGSVAGIAGPVPVVRVVFDEREFFDEGSAILRPEALPIVDLIAENMKRDVPDAALTILGHTDAVGSDSANIALSKRRAAEVMTLLIARGVDPGELSTVAIGKRQPIAPNSTAVGRARNRRVEFMISASLAANLALVQRRHVNPAYFSLTRNAPPSRVSNTVEVLKPRHMSAAAAQSMSRLIASGSEPAPGGDTMSAILSPYAKLTLPSPQPAEIAPPQAPSPSLSGTLHAI